jgi:UDP-glucose 4-epimerase
MAKILITGGAGFIGSNIAEALHEKHEIVVIDDLSTSGPPSSEYVQNLASEGKIKFEEGSINDINLISELLIDVEYVLHQAAIPSVPRSVKDPLASNSANVGGSLTVLKACVDAGVKKIVAASSSSVYGDTPTLPKIETMQPHPLSPYAVSKFAMEHYMRVFNELYGIQTLTLRYFNVFGPRQNPYSEYAAVIPKFIKAAKEGQPLMIYGDGTQTRDFSYVKDVVAANVKAAESKKSGIFNIAGGNQITITELAEAIISTTDSQSKIEYLKSRAGDIKHSLADVFKARNELNWSPTYSLQDGLEDYLSYSDLF